MKGMSKISRGKGMQGAVAYVLDGGQLIGGNMAGADLDELTAEFQASKSLRPDIEKHVWHNSLRLPKGDSLPNEKWTEIGDRYMEKMGFTKDHQRIYVLHDDQAGQHIHIVASRIALDSSVFLGRNENLKSTRIISSLEKEFGLTVTKGPGYDQDGKTIMPNRSKPTKNEIEKSFRTGIQPVRTQLQEIISEAVKGKPTFTAFVERLESAGVGVRPVVAKGAVTGLSFSLDEVSFSGSKLGKGFKFNELKEKGLDYDKDRDSECVERLRAQAKSAEVDARVTEDNRESEPGNSENAERAYPANSEDRRRLRPGDDSGVDSSIGADRRDLDISTEADGGSTADDEHISDRDPIDGYSDAPGDSEPRRSSETDTQEGGTEKESGTAATDHDATASKETPLVDSGFSSNESGGAGGPGSAGGEVADTDIITTGNKAIDELSRAFKNARKKADQEAVEHASRMWSQIPAKSAPNMFLQALKSFASRIFSISTMREREEENRRMQAEALARQTAAAEAARQAEIDAAIERNTEKLEQERALDGRAVEDHPEVMSKHKKPKSRYERDEGLSR